MSFEITLETAVVAALAGAGVAGIFNLINTWWRHHLEIKRAERLAAIQERERAASRSGLAANIERLARRPAPSIPWHLRDDVYYFVTSILLLGFWGLLAGLLIDEGGIWTVVIALAVSLVVIVINWYVVQGSRRKANTPPRRR